MDEDFSHNCVCLFSILASTIVFVIILKLSQNRNKKKLPPGNMGFPWIGETWEFYKAQRVNHLFEEFIQPRIAKHGKIFKTHLMGSPTVIVNGANANKFVLSNEFKMVISSWPSSSVQLMGKNSIMEKQGERHRCLRGLISTTFGNAGLETLVPKICSSVLLHLDRKWSEKEDISLYRSTKIMTFTIVFECLLGISVKPGMLETFERVLEGVFALPVQFPGSKFSRATKARSEIEKMIVEEVREKRIQMESRGGGERTGRRDVAVSISRWNDSRRDQRRREHLDLTIDKRPGESLTLDDIKKMKYTWQVARESMRLFPPIFGSFRKAIVDIEYQGFTIPKGWKVLWTAYGTHYNAECFQDPSSFNPSRFDEPVPPYVFLPFGGGPRVCAGYQLAKLIILIFVHFVVKRYDWSLLYPDETITMDPLPFPSHGMPIKISPKDLKK
ncbi:hypothetical protein CsatB_021494 [Cannabis sativa]